jgi:predicted MPP superfamily phosphohydrolase
MFAVTGNHEFGIGKGPFARAKDSSYVWEEAGITLLRDRCVLLPQKDGASIAICGADYLTGGYDLVSAAAPLARGGAFPILLIHEPPPPDSPLAASFPLVFAGHTHGGQIRLPTLRGLTPVNGEDGVHLGGVYNWGGGEDEEGILVVSKGVGTSFLPFRLFTRPEATLWRLV